MEHWPSYSKPIYRICLLKNSEQKRIKDEQYQKMYCFQLLLNKYLFNAVLNIVTLNLFLIFAGIDFQSSGPW